MENECNVFGTSVHFVSSLIRHSQKAQLEFAPDSLFKMQCLSPIHVYSVAQRLSGRLFDLRSKVTGSRFIGRIVLCH